MMEAKYRSISVVFVLLFLVQKASADYLSTLFGTSAEDDNTVLYVTIAFVLLSIFLIIFMIICLYLLYKLMKERARKRKEQLAMEERRRWKGGVDDIIDDADRMVPLPRAASTTEKSYVDGYSNAGIDFVSSRI